MLLGTGCAEVIAGIRGGIDLAQLIYSANKETIVIQSAECAGIEPIYHTDESVVSDDIKDQIIEQAIRLEQLCPDGHSISF